jgi:hypothetical protein
VTPYLIIVDFTKKKGIPRHAPISSDGQWWVLVKFGTWIGKTEDGHVLGIGITVHQKLGRKAAIIVRSWHGLAQQLAYLAKTKWK